MLAIDLKGKKALVSGVSSGIGAGIARQLARAGCDVVGCGRSAADSKGARDFCANVQAEGRRAIYHSVDIATLNGPRDWVQQAANELGGIDIVVSNAGRN